MVGLHANEALLDTGHDVLAREDVRVTLAPRGRRRADDAAALARQVVLGAPARDVPADPLFAEAIVDRGIDVVDAGVEHGVENRLRLLLADVARARRSAQLHRAVPQHRDLKPGAPEFPFRQISHGPSSSLDT